MGRGRVFWGKRWGQLVLEKGDTQKARKWTAWDCEPLPWATIPRAVGATEGALLQEPGAPP